MIQRLKAVFRNGVFVPSEKCNVSENEEVQLTVASSHLIPPTITDEDEWQKGMSALIEHMQRNPIPEGSPRFTRDELHERR